MNFETSTRNLEGINLDPRVLSGFFVSGWSPGGCTVFIVHGLARFVLVSIFYFRQVGQSSTLSRHQFKPYFECYIHRLK